MKTDSTPRKDPLTAETSQRADRPSMPRPFQPSASPSQLVQAVCRSRMVQGGDAWVELLSQARRENRKRNITGVLVRQGDAVLLVLEGTAERVGEVLTAIGRDPRHVGLSVLRVRSALKRDFPGWWMASTQLDIDRFIRIERAFASDDPDAGRRLRAFIVDGEWMPEPTLGGAALLTPMSRRTNHVGLAAHANGGETAASAVRAVRVRSGLTQTEFARRFGVPLHTLRNWEQGKRAPTGAAATLIRIMTVMPEVVSAIAATAPPLMRPN
ncbi:MAG: BLUF domain-containing protein [Burkholderiales bacterium]|nr:BLUF domain-containing protein [Burkholderiales bacterium]